MKHYALTGGIGSGKSTLLKMFQEIGIPTFSADQEARHLMHKDQTLKAKITDLLGADAYVDGKLNSSGIAAKVFDNNTLLDKLNALVHPAVQREYAQWKATQEAPYTVYEAAILFEHQAQDRFDGTILVVSPEDIRIKRVRDRDGVSKASVMNRMKHQLTDAQKIPLASYLIDNVTLSDMRRQLTELHQQLLVVS